MCSHPFDGCLGGLNRRVPILDELGPTWTLDRVKLLVKGTTTAVKHVHRRQGRSRRSNRLHISTIVPQVPTDVLSVVLADGHHFFREGLRGMLEGAGMTVVGEARTGVEAIDLTRELRPDVIVIDLDIPEASGDGALRQIALASPESRVVVLTASYDDRDVLDTFQAGASAFLFKSARVDDLVDGIRQAGRGQAVLSFAAMRALVSCFHHPEGAMRSREHPSLTTRELDVLRLMVEGADNAAIGLALSISRHTVKQYVTNIFEKLEVHTRVEAAVYAVRSGLV